MKGSSNLSKADKDAIGLEWEQRVHGTLKFNSEFPIANNKLQLLPAKVHTNVADLTQLLGKSGSVESGGTQLTPQC